ncbi:MAG: pantoate--beta-alanine ligase [Actinomycetota bacterium]|nr:pantoate--beta-alanine ligase [Actinomycetota bacterium]
MKVINNIKNCKTAMEKLENKGFSVGFVPTMGSFHEGHLNLIRKAVEECDRVVVSIFVNPTQFGPDEDLEKYPRNFRRDRLLAEEEGVDYVFHPDVEEMYPPGNRTWVDVSGLSSIMCGKFRPGHFRGVATVVLKLFNIINPERAYFGEKDYQQMVIVKRMVKDLNLDIKIAGCPTVREKDGLAMSSRNKYLSKRERREAVILYECIKMSEKMVLKGEKDLNKIKRKAERRLKDSRFVKKIDYFDFRDPLTLGKKKKVRSGDKNILAAAAVWVGSIRLIDNMVIKL